MFNSLVRDGQSMGRSDLPSRNLWRVTNFFLTFKQLVQSNQH